MRLSKFVSGLLYVAAFLLACFGAFMFYAGAVTDAPPADKIFPMVGGLFILALAATTYFIGWSMKQPPLGQASTETLIRVRRTPAEGFDYFGDDTNK